MAIPAELGGYKMLTYQSKIRSYQGLGMDIKTNVDILEKKNLNIKGQNTRAFILTWQLSTNSVSPEF